MEKAGINLPRTAQQQYDVTSISHIGAQAGDLVFFILPITLALILPCWDIPGNNRMFHAGDPIGYADLTSPTGNSISGSRTNQTMRKEDLMMKFRKSE